MYHWLRNTHLMLGLFCLLFLLMYSISAVQMAHTGLFDLAPEVTRQTVAIPPGLEPRAAARTLMDRHGMRGELNQVKETPAGSGFRIARPGAVYEVDYEKATGSAQIRVNKATFMGVLNRIHHAAGLWHDSSVLNAWGYAVGVVSIALLILGITGIYLWFKIHRERRIGLALLIAGLGFGVTLLISIRTA